MNRKGVFLAALVLGSAVCAMAQVHSNAPTDKDYRLVIVSPKDGASITGTDLTIVLGQPRIPTGHSVNEKERTDVMTPTFQVWVDSKDYGNLPSGQNVFTAHDLSYGSHRIRVAAKNTAGELVDRKEIGVTTVTGVTAGSVTTQQTDQVPPATEPAAESMAPPPPAQTRYQAPAQTQPAATEPPPSAPLSSLPQTATSYPAAAVGGLGLLLVGLALCRPRRS